MSIKDDLIKRSGGICELCGSEENLEVYEVSPSDGSVDQAILVCEKCNNNLSNLDETTIDDWHCLNDSMWSGVAAVQVVAYRVLKSVGAQDLLDQLYLEDDIKAWADAQSSSNSDSAEVKDSNGVTLVNGDSVTIIKDLDVKGANFTAKRGTVVKNITLNGIEGQIEGRVNGTKIVLLSKFLKKV
jgi:protein PhnA